MKRRAFLQKLGLGAGMAGAATIVPMGIAKTSMASDPNPDPDFDSDAKCLTPHERGVPRPEMPVKVQAEMDRIWPHGGRQNLAYLACLTNGRLWKMVLKYNVRGKGKWDSEWGVAKTREKVEEMRGLIAVDPVFFRKIRHHYGCSFYKGWFNTHVRNFLGSKFV